MHDTSTSIGYRYCTRKMSANHTTRIPVVYACLWQSLLKLCLSCSENWQVSASTRTCTCWVKRCFGCVPLGAFIHSFNQLLTLWVLCQHLKGVCCVVYTGCVCCRTTDHRLNTALMNSGCPAVARLNTWETSVPSVVQLQGISAIGFSAKLQHKDTSNPPVWRQNGKLLPPERTRSRCVLYLLLFTFSRSAGCRREVKGR